MRHWFLAAILALTMGAWAEEKPRAEIISPVPIPAVTVPVITPAQPMPTIIVNVPPAVNPVTATPIAQTGPSTADTVQAAIQAALAKYKADVDANPEAPAWKHVLNALWAGLLAAATAAIAFVSKQVHLRIANSNLAEEDKQALEALNTGVTSAEEELAEDYRQRAADGVIDEADAAALRAHALEVAKSVAKGPGLKALNTMAVPRVKDLIDRILQHRKAQQATIDLSRAQVAAATPPNLKPAVAS